MQAFHVKSWEICQSICYHHPRHSELCGVWVYVGKRKDCYLKEAHGGWIQKEGVTSGLKLDKSNCPGINVKQLQPENMKGVEFGKVYNGKGSAK